VQNHKKILVFTATYNEAGNINELINSIILQPTKLDLLIIDDNSPDGTSKIIEKNQEKFSNLYLIKRNGKLGLDTAHREAYEYALKKNYDCLITMDADFSHDPNEIINFINYLDEYSFVIGSRYMEGGKCLMKGRRLILSKYGNLFMKLFLKIDCSEFTTSFRGFNIKKLNNFHLNQVYTNGYSFFMGTIYEIFNRKFSTKEIPITFKDRTKGYSKIPRIEIIRTLFNLLRLKLK
tara:strand:+ start:185 stop:889 length:705 start_codon:yes stop_codon:yes gene_type:complete